MCGDSLLIKKDVEEFPRTEYKIISDVLRFGKAL